VGAQCARDTFQVQPVGFSSQIWPRCLRSKSLRAKISCLAGRDHSILLVKGLYLLKLGPEEEQYRYLGHRRHFLWAIQAKTALRQSLRVQNWPSKKSLVQGQLYVNPHYFLLFLQCYMSLRNPEKIRSLNVSSSLWEHKVQGSFSDFARRIFQPDLAHGPL